MNSLGVWIRTTLPNLKNFYFDKYCYFIKIQIHGARFHARFRIA